MLPRSKTADPMVPWPVPAVRPAVGNVVRLERHRPGAPDLAARDRPAPPAPRGGRSVLPVLLMASLGLHAVLLMRVDRAPAPAMSVGEEVISIELVVGADSPAGVALPTVAQDAPKTPVDRPQEQAIDEPPAPREEQAARVEPAPEAAQSKPSEPLHRDETVVAVVAPKPVLEQEREPQQERTAAPSAPAGGVGRGRSASDQGYVARVVAHLARFKRFPADARRTPGTATVSFSIDGHGHVTVASLARGSGQAALDREAVALVRRASPFPPPPSGRGRDFTAPVSFELR